MASVLLSACFTTLKDGSISKARIPSRLDYQLWMQRVFCSGMRLEVFELFYQFWNTVHTQREVLWKWPCRVYSLTPRVQYVILRMGWRRETTTGCRTSPSVSTSCSDISFHFIQSNYASIQIRENPINSSYQTALPPTTYWNGNFLHRLFIYEGQTSSNNLS